MTQHRRHPTQTPLVVAAACAFLWIGCSGNASRSNTSQYPARCGNGWLEEDEPCDDGGESASCDRNCTPVACGDRELNATAGELCDDGNTLNESACDYGLLACGLCDAECQVLVEGDASFCGDGLIDAESGEECDDGNARDEPCAYGVVACQVCDSMCWLVPGAISVCGDGVVDPGEGCDDGNAVDTDECANACAPPGCGDGVLTANERCDDGNSDETDGCLSTCAVARCGDGRVKTGFEMCDDGNVMDGDSCNADCTVACTLEWWRVYDRAGWHDAGTGVAVGPNGGAILVGYDKDRDDESRAIVRRYDASGAVTSMRRWPGPGAITAKGHAVAIDANDAVYIAGQQWPGPDGGVGDAFLQKVDPSGTVAWTRTYTGEVSYTAAYGVAIDGSGNVIAIGYESTFGSPGAWLRKYDAAGNLLWHQTHRVATHTVSGRAVAIDSQDNIVATGSDHGQDDVERWWVDKYDPDGNLLWTNEEDGSGDYNSVGGRGVDVDGDDNIVVAALQTPGSCTVNVAKYDPSGIELWRRAFDPSGDGHCTYEAGLSVSPTGRIGVVAGSELRHLDGDGNLLCRATLDARGASISFDGSGASYVTGWVLPDDHQDVWLGRFAP